MYTPEGSTGAASEYWAEDDVDRASVVTVVVVVVVVFVFESLVPLLSLSKHTGPPARDTERPAEFHTAVMDGNIRPISVAIRGGLR